MTVTPFDPNADLIVVDVELIGRLGLADLQRAGEHQPPGEGQWWRGVNPAPKGR
ncbi:MAG: hypothetical protein HY901_01390 [Deltaproteobacteria bacterium]|nr:hypothetical protein [Deltaproteobacteria bacterium]